MTDPASCWAAAHDLRPFRIIRADVERIARESWGVYWPVHVERRIRRYDRRTGFYTVRAGRDGFHCPQRTDGAWWHRIQLTNAPLEYMLQTLAHELEHARQCETVGPVTMAWLYGHYGAFAKRLGFRGRPNVRSGEAYERGAEAAEERWAELLPCIRFTQTRGAA